MPGLHHAPNHSQSSIRKKVQDLKEKSLATTFDDVILPTIAEIINGSKDSWRFTVFKSENYSESNGNMMKRDLKFNVNFGNFNEDQSFFIMDLISRHFPSIDSNLLIEVLLPEALIYLCCHLFQMSYNQAETYLSTCGRKAVDDFMKKLRQKSKSKNPKKRSTTKRKISLDDDPDVKLIKKTKMDKQSVLKMQRPHFKLDEGDGDIINNAVLTDKHIQMAQELLHRQFPHTGGLLSPSIRTAKQFPVMRGEFVQVLHTGGFHWVCVSNIGCQRLHDIKLFDSLYRGIAPFTKEQIAGLLFVEDSDTIQVQVPPVQQQTNSTDCGVFAIAFATALCYKQDLTTLKFNRREIRTHLWNSLQNDYIGIFPFEERKPNDPEYHVTLKVYCDCRLPYSATKDQMAACSLCKKWFHKEGCNIPEKVFKFKRFQWKCKTCALKNVTNKKIHPLHQHYSSTKHTNN